MEHKAIIFSHSGDFSGVQFLGFFNVSSDTIIAPDMMDYPLFLQVEKHIQM